MYEGSIRAERVKKHLKLSVNYLFHAVAELRVLGKCTILLIKNMIFAIIAVTKYSYL